MTTPPLPCLLWFGRIWFFPRPNALTFLPICCFWEQAATTSLGLRFLCSSSSRVGWATTITLTSLGTISSFQGMGLTSPPCCTLGEQLGMAGSMALPLWVQPSLLRVRASHLSSFCCTLGEKLGMAGSMTLISLGMTWVWTSPLFSLCCRLGELGMAGSMALTTSYFSHHRNRCRRQRRRRRREAQTQC